MNVWKCNPFKMLSKEVFQILENEYKDRKEEYGNSDKLGSELRKTIKKQHTKSSRLKRKELLRKELKNHETYH